MGKLNKIEQSNREFLERHDITCTKSKDGGWELESYTDGGGDQIVYVNHLTSNELIGYLENYNVNEETNLWFPNGQPGKGVPFDNYKDLWDDIENWRQWMLGIAEQMPYGRKQCEAAKTDLSVENNNTMTDKQKAAELLNFMEEEWDGKAIINALNPYLKDSDLAELYDKMVADGIIK